MEPSVTQELEYGCGVACFAFVCNITFQQAITFLGRGYSVKHGWRPSDLVTALNVYGYSYRNKYVRKKDMVSYEEGTIILIERSSEYPVGHYLVRHNTQWMDPWFNMHNNDGIQKAKSGFREVLPGKPMYALYPLVDNRMATTKGLTAKSPNHPNPPQFTSTMNV